MKKFEVLVNDHHIVLKYGISTLWFERLNSDTVLQQIKVELKIIKEDETKVFENFFCYGLSYGLVGVFQTSKLILIKKCQSIGLLPYGSNDELFKIQKICILSLNHQKELFGDLGLDKCSSETCSKPTIISIPSSLFIKASFNESSNDEPSLQIQTSSLLNSNVGANSVQRTWNQIKSTASTVKPRVSSKISMISSLNNQNILKIEDKEKVERRLIDEVYKMFNDTNSFYFSWTGDITNSIQRQQKLKKNENCDRSFLNNKNLLWKCVDDRFFWNKYMLKLIIDLFEQLVTLTKFENDEQQQQCLCSQIWILPIIQGFVQIEKCFFDLNDNSPVGITSKIIDSDFKNNVIDEKFDDLFRETHDYYWMTLISRRSRFRSGTRYKKRGLDENGKCANYVETEQMFTYGLHTVSFVSVRASIPLFWSQPGHKYRPPPLLEKSEKENQEAFDKHFEQEFEIYGDNVIAISLVEQTGREKVLSDAYLHHSTAMNDSRLTYVTFDFHDYCRGMKFENVSILIDRIFELIKEIRYCWVDSDGLICEQKGVFRINCIDCLDRTNIVMTAIARHVMDVQLVRLGLLPPEGQLSANAKRIFQLMWAHNGDTISRQYAGTVALKGDYTRTGERKISGVVRDGVNSANRYYLNRFKDAYRQALIDLMQGNPISDILSSPEHEKSLTKTSVASLTNFSLSTSDQEYHERIKLVIEDCKKVLVSEDEVILGGWPLVDADPFTGTPLSSARINNESLEYEMDIVLILTKDCYYVAEYDAETDRILKVQKVFLEDLEKIEVGTEPNFLTGPFSSMRNTNRIISYAVRFYYALSNQTGYFHMFRSTNTRFFNNMAIPICTREESLESLKAICESFKVALSVKSLNVPYLEVSRLERKKSKRIYNSSYKLGNNETLNRKFPSNSNENSTLQKASMFNVYSHFSKLRGKLTGGIFKSSQTHIVQSNFGTLSGDNFEEESEDEDSFTEIKKKISIKQSSHRLSVERTLSLDFSDVSDIEDSEQILPPISEISSPCLEDVICDKEPIDRVLESCGIIVTSPPLRINAIDLEIENENKSQSFLVSNNKKKSLLNDVDDFVLDSMKKASLRHIHRKALSQSQVSLCSSINAKKELKNFQINSFKNETTFNDKSINKCIFSSELALNSIVSQSMKKNILNNIPGSYSTDTLDANNSDNYGHYTSNNFREQENFNLINTPSLPGTEKNLELIKNDHPIIILKPYNVNNNTEESYEFNGDINDQNSSAHKEIYKEVSLSTTDLASTSFHRGLKTSRSSVALQCSEDLTPLNLHSTNSTSVLSIHEQKKDDKILSDKEQESRFLTSTLMVKKDLVVSPLTRIARGMQSLGLNLRNSMQSDFQQSKTKESLDIDSQKLQTRTRIIEI